MRERKCAGYSELVDHIWTTFKEKKGVNYPFTAEDGRHVKALLALNELSVLRALWDIFLAEDWSWIDKETGGVRVLPHSIRIFRGKLIDLCDERYKPKRTRLTRKYQEEEPIKKTAQKIPPIQFEVIPPREDGQMNKVEGIRELDAWAVEENLAEKR